MKVVITGNPGVGKHTVARHIASDLKYQIIDINKIALESEIYEKSGETLDVEVTQLKKKIRNIIKNNSIIVGHLAPYVLTKPQIDKVVILRKSPYGLIPVYKNRNYSKQKIFENLQSEILGIITYDAIKKFGEKKSFLIDTTEKSIKKILNQIKDILNEQGDGDEVDWLEEITKRNDLRKFFPN